MEPELLLAGVGYRDCEPVTLEGVFPARADGAQMQVGGHLFGQLAREKLVGLVRLVAVVDDQRGDRLDHLRRQARPVGQLLLGNRDRAVGDGLGDLRSFVASDGILDLADQDELVAQPLKAIDDWANVLAAVEKAQKRAPLGAKVVVGSSQTLSRPNRLQRFPEDYFDYIIIDEAHRGAERDRKICEYFHRAKTLGLTATPFNSAMRDLSKFYEHVAFDLPMLDLIDQGWAPPISVMTLPVEIDLGGVEKEPTGEYALEGLSTTIAPWYDRIAELLKENAADRHTIVFLPLIQSSKAFAEICRRHGLRAIHVDANSEDRAGILERFRDGAYQILCNVQVVETGVDVPIADCFVNLRPIKSAAKYQQGLGRAMRPLPGVVDDLLNAEDRKAAILASAKPNTLIIDFLWQHDKLGVMHPGHLFAKSDEEANAILERTKKVRTPEELQAIAKAVLAEREQKLVKRLEELAVLDPTKMIDARLFAHLCAYQFIVRYEPLSHWEMEPASERQLHTLASWGIHPDTVDSKGLARKLIDACMFRIKYKMAGPHHVRELHALQIPFQHNISAAEAISLLHEHKRHVLQPVPNRLEEAGVS